MKHGFFILNGQNSRDLGIVITEPPKDVYAERDVTYLNIPGKSGSLVVDNGFYKNVELQYKCAIIPKRGQTMRDAATTAMGLLRRATGYIRLEDTFAPRHHRMAMLVSAVTVKSVMEKAGEFTLRFNCKPQRYLRSGERLEHFTSPGQLMNPSGFAARPLITVYGTGPGDLTVGAITVEVKALTDMLILDCDTMNAYRQMGDGIVLNKNCDIYAPEFPELGPGSSAIAWTGGITSVDIVPRWWTL